MPISPSALLTSFEWTVWAIVATRRSIGDFSPLRRGNEHFQMNYRPHERRLKQRSVPAGTRIAMNPISPRCEKLLWPAVKPYNQFDILYWRLFIIIYGWGEKDFCDLFWYVRCDFTANETISFDLRQADFQPKRTRCFFSKADAILRAQEIFCAAQIANSPFQRHSIRYDRVIRLWADHTTDSQLTCIHLIRIGSIKIMRCNVSAFTCARTAE